MAQNLFKLVGGKFYLSDFILSHFPLDYQDYHYVESFIGGGSLGLTKEKSHKSTIFADINPNYIKAYQYVQTLTSGELERLTNTRFTKETFLDSKQKLGQDGYHTLVVQRMSRGGLGKDFSESSRLRGGQIEGQNAWDNFVKKILDIKEKLSGVMLLTQGFEKTLTEWDSERTIHFVDPPYLTETRTKKLYDYEIDRNAHILLGYYLNLCKGKVLLSGYNSSLYNELYKDWNKVEKVIANHSGQNSVKQKRTECIWMNY